MKKKTKRILAYVFLVAGIIIGALLVLSIFKVI